MELIDINLIATENILDIVPLLKLVNTTTSESILRQRLETMVKEHYQCAGLYLNQELIGIAGMWFITRHYSGKTMEPDHVVIQNKHRNKGYGEILMNWTHQYAQNTGCEAAELNSYINNPKSHKFYENLGYEKLAYHFLKIL